MVDAIKVLKDMLEYDIEESLIRTQRVGEEIERELKPEIIKSVKKALLALQKKEDDRKQGALEELKELLQHIDWSQANKREIVLAINKRIRELEKEVKE